MELKLVDELTTISSFIKRNPELSPLQSAEVTVMGETLFKSGMVFAEAIAKFLDEIGPQDLAKANFLLNYVSSWGKIVTEELHAALKEIGSTDDSPNIAELK